MREKFTPGEWRVEYYNEWDIAGVFIVDKEGEPIAKMCERFVKIPMPGSNFTQLVESKEEQRVNTSLIEATPDLYNALKDLVGNSRSGWQEVNVSKETIDNALKALKKASGGEE